MKKAIPELLSRIVIGLVFIESGWGKLHNLQDVVSYFESLHIPFANIQAPFVAAVELSAGLFVITGILTRFSVLPLIAIMLVAIRTAKWEDITDIPSLLEVPEFLYIVILSWLAIYGSQFLSVDAFLKKRACKSGACK